MLLSRFIRSRRFVPRTRTGLPCSQGTPLCLCPALRPRPDLDASPSAALRCCPRRSDNESSSDELLFRGSFTRLQHWLFTLRAAISGRLRKTRFRGWPTFPGWDSSVPTEFLWRVLGLPRPAPLPGLVMARQISNLLYRRFVIGKPSGIPTAVPDYGETSRLETGDTADWKSALRSLDVLSPIPPSSLVTGMPEARFSTTQELQRYGAGQTMTLPTCSVGYPEGIPNGAMSVCGPGQWLLESLLAAAQSLPGAGRQDGGGFDAFGNFDFETEAGAVFAPAAGDAAAGSLQGRFRAGQGDRDSGQ